MTRRDRCYLVGRRAKRLEPPQAAIAWDELATLVENFGDRDMPKFDDLLKAIRTATIEGAQVPKH